MNIYRCVRKVSVYRYRIKFYSKKSNGNNNNNNKKIRSSTQFLRKFKKKRIESSSKELLSRVKVAARTEILHCSNSLQFPYRRFRCVSRGDSELAPWKRENTVER